MRAFLFFKKQKSKILFENFIIRVFLIYIASNWLVVMDKDKDEYEIFKQFRLQRAEQLRKHECIKFTADYQSQDICKSKDWTLCENNEKAINDWINCENKPRCFCQLFGLSRKRAMRAGLISSCTPNAD